MSRLDAFLHQLTLANQLTLLRLVAVPAFALTLLEGRPDWALAIYVGAGITDRLDGIAARRLGQQTALGTFLDPAADKLLMLVTYVLLAWPDRPRPFPDFALVHHVPAWLTVLVIARDALIILVALGLYIAYGQSRFEPSRLGKWTTGVEMVGAGLFLLANVWSGVPEWLLVFAIYATTALLVSSGIAYLLRLSRAQRHREEVRP
jgi:cardiolipin synthase